MSYRLVQKESDELLYTATVWSLVMVRNQLPAQAVKESAFGPELWTLNWGLLYAFGRVMMSVLNCT